MSHVRSDSTHFLPPEARRFYDGVYEQGREPEAAREAGRDEWEKKVVESFIAAFCGGGPVLEAGCGHAPYQHRIPGYIGIDISANCAAYITEPFAAASATALPFADDSMAAVITLHTLEHVHAPARMLEEIHRVLRPGAAALLLPSWYVRFWAPQGLGARRYADLNLKWKLVKLAMPMLDAPLLRGLAVLPRRLAALFVFSVRRQPTTLRYRRIPANYDTFLDSDSDACASIDPFQVILYFHSRGCAIPALPTWTKRLLFRTGPLVVVKGERE